jgi:hypothetical protein
MIDLTCVLFLKAGMWGFYNERNRAIANKVYEFLVDREISSNYKKNNEFGMDQAYPIIYIFPHIAKTTMTHDSYFCTNDLYKTAENLPFPVQRDGACWVGIWYNPGIDCKNQDPSLFKCKIECRPKNHKDWLYC